MSGFPPPPAPPQESPSTTRGSSDGKACRIPRTISYRGRMKCLLSSLSQVSDVSHVCLPFLGVSILCCHSLSSHLGHLLYVAEVGLGSALLNRGEQPWVMVSAMPWALVMRRGSPLGPHFWDIQKQL